jgi:hypothetical protein
MIEYMTPNQLQSSCQRLFDRDHITKENLPQTEKLSSYFQLKVVLVLTMKDKISVGCMKDGFLFFETK